MLREELTQPVTSLLHSIWEADSWRDEVVTTFESWIQDGTSRSDARNKVKALIARSLAEQPAKRANKVDLEQVNWDQLVEFLCACFYCKRFRRPLPDVPSDELWISLTDRQNWGALSLHPQQEKAIRETVPVPLFPLEQKLLAHGGNRLAYRPEPDLQLLLKRGEAFEGNAELVPGKPGQCHLNVAQFWSKQRKGLAIVTGYALSEDGCWRQHSWLLRQVADPAQYHLIETTIKRTKYFGAVLTRDEAERFFQGNG